MTRTPAQAQLSFDDFLAPPGRVGVATRKPLQPAGSPGTKAGWLAVARGLAATIAKREGAVTIDDILRVIQRPDGIPQNLGGAVFAKGGFVKVGMATSQGRKVGLWKLRPDESEESKDDEANCNETGGTSGY